MMPTPRGLTIYLYRIYFERREAEGAMLVGLVEPKTERERALRDLSLALRAMTVVARGSVAIASADTEGTYRTRFGGVGRGETQPTGATYQTTTLHLPLRRLPLPMRWVDPKGLRVVHELRSRVRWANVDVALGRATFSFGLPEHLEAVVGRVLDGGRVSLGVDWSHLRPAPERAAPGPIGSAYDDQTAALAHHLSLSVDAEIDRLYARFDSLRDHGTLHVLSRGVHVERRPLEAFPPGVVAILDLDEARRDLAESRVITDAVFDGHLQAVATLRDELRGAIDHRLEHVRAESIRLRGGADVARRKTAALRVVAKAL